jgi:hypothetical protein
MQPGVVAITQDRLDELTRERIAAALPNHIVRGIARQMIRKELGVMTLEEAARFLKWTDPEALRQKLARAGVDKIKTSSRILTYTVVDLVKFRERNRNKGHAKSRRPKILKLEGNNAA